MTNGVNSAESFAAFPLHLIAGVLLILIGAGLNEVFLASLLGSDASISAARLVELRVFNVASVLAGVALVMHRRLPVSVVAITCAAALLVFGCTVHFFEGYSSPDQSLHAFGRDDAYIHYRYALNFADGNGLVFNVGERVADISGPDITTWIGSSAR